MKNFIPCERFQQKCVSRRNLIRGAAGTALGTGLLGGLKSAHAREHEEAENFGPKPIPGGFGPFSPFGVFIHHKPPTPGMPLHDINEPSQITDFNGFVGLTRIRGGGIGTNTITGATMNLAFQADMGFNQGEFIGTDGQRHKGTFGFV